MHKNDLVSIVVLSYNAEETILETLNSILNQTYKDIELIISDDSSNDSTIKVVKKWISDNQDRFVNCIINAQEVNVGVTQNMISGISKASGKWIKIIAADDLLMPSCIYDNLNFASENADIKFIFSNMMCFNGKKEWPVLNEIDEKKMLKWNKYSLEKQKNKIIRESLALTPSIFFEKEYFDHLTVDFRVCRNLEDWPFHISIIHSGNRIGYFNAYTIQYRKHDSLSFRNDSSYCNERLLVDIYKIKKEMCYPRVSKWDVVYWWNELFVKINYYLMIHLFHNKKSMMKNIFIALICIFYPNGWKKIIAAIRNFK